MRNPAHYAFTQGYAIRTPAGVILGHTYRKTEEQAVAALFENPRTREKYWKAAQAEGCTCQFVYARMFTPVYFATQIAVTDGEAA